MVYLYVLLYTCTLILHAAIAVATTVTTEPLATTNEPSDTAPVPVSSGLSTVHYIVIGAASAAVVILLGAIMTAIITK